jgi:hypoxanthine phosphoribosyltransferase
MRHEVLFSAEELAARVRDLAARIDHDRNTDEPLLVVVVLKGAVMFATDLVRAMRTPTELAFVTASSYGGGFSPSETLAIGDDADLDVDGRSLLIVDDIIDTGRTLRAIASRMLDRGARSVATVALINKTSRRSDGLEADYSGIEIGEEFIYGYGLDWDEQFRDLPFIARADPSDP